MSLGLDREDEVLNPRRSASLRVLARIHPEVCGPHADTEFLGEEDRAQGLPATKVEHLHARLQIQDLTERLG
jgi:hypothetical protein